ncbi:MAG: alpha/beta hydrolase [Thermoanaerobaculia bacterium]|nr:alpha/beta hydrolase [Thermoanaerobaculia bacterium]
MSRPLSRDFVPDSDDDSRLCPGTLPIPIVGAPQRPNPWMERVGRRLLLALAPRLGACRETAPPPDLAPFEPIEVPRSDDPGALRGWFFRANGLPGYDEPRGAVLLCHPWLPFGQAYFFRRGRIPALRQAGYHVMTFDLGGFGPEEHLASAPWGYYDRDVDDALAELARRVDGLPIHLWGVSAGGYWSHLALSRRAEPIHGAFFEHVTDHMIEWSKRMAPAGLPCYLFYQHVLRPAYRYLDLNRHAAHLQARAVAYVGGDLDRGAPVEALHRMARLAQAARLVVGDADHLDAIRRQGRQVIDLALQTFRKAEGVR